MKKIAVTSNDVELSIKVIDKLIDTGVIKIGAINENQLTYMCYIIELNITVSPLALEMHYPEYELIYGTDFLKL